MSTTGGPGHGGTALSAPPQVPGQLPRAVAFTPAVRGYPGGLDDITLDQDDFTADGETGGVADRADGAGDSPDAGGLPGASVWQQSHTAWQEAGIDWLREARPAPGTQDQAADESHTEPIPVVPADDEAVDDEAVIDDSDVVILRNGAVATGQAGPAAGTHAAPAGSAATTGGAITGEASQGGSARPGKRVLVVAGITAAAVIAGTITGIAVARSGGPARSGFGLATPYPPAAFADGDFTAPAAKPAMLPVLTGVAGAGKTIVAIGSQGAPALPVPLIMVSQDGGRTWARASLGHTATAPGPGAVPVLAVRGHGGWLALGQHCAWTSADGSAWQAAPPLPMPPGDKILGLTRTQFGFAAVGENIPGPAASGVPGPVLWISPDGRTWQRKSGAVLSLGAGGGLDASGGSVVSLRWAAYRAGVIIVGGEISRPMVKHRGKRKIIVSVESPGLWRSKDNGATWNPVKIPASHGAAAGLAGLAASGPAFVAIRPGRTLAGRKDAVAYMSATGATWRYAGRLTAGRRTPLTVTLVSGSQQGVVVSGSTGTSRVAFVSARGRIWRKVGDQGRSASTTVAAMTVAPGTVAVAAGARLQAGSAAGSRSPYILLAGTGATAGRTEVGQPVLAAASTAAVTVNGLAATATEQVAAGSADGAPALWWAPAGGHWTPSVIAAPGTGSLTSVVHGRAGWLAIGGTGAPASPGPPPPGPPGSSAPPAPVIVMSADGRSWHPSPGDQLLGAPGTVLAQAAAGPDGYVAVGSQPGPGGMPESAAWFSAGLATWARATVGASAAGQMLAVTAARPGFVAVGSAGRVPAVWTSPTGSAWRPIALPLPAGAASAALTTVAAVGGRVLAAGTASRAGTIPGAAEQIPFAAVSGDGGRHWRESMLPAVSSPATVTALTAANGGFVAAGLTTVAGNQAMICWWSPNGITWQHAPVTGPAAGGGVQQIMALSVRSNALTGAGYSVIQPGEHPLLWHARFR